MARVAIVTLYNPGSIGARYVAACLRAAGHDVWFLHFKEFRATFLPSEEAEAREAAEKNPRVILARSRRPGCWVYVPALGKIRESEYELFLSELRRLRPDVAAFSFYTVTVGVAEDLTALVRRELPGLPVLWAGIHAILDPEACIRHADIVCVGEGEDAAVELMNRWDEYRKQGALDVAGFWFRKGGEIVRNPRGAVVKDLDRIPFPAYGAQERVIEDGRVADTLSEENLRNEFHLLVFTGRGCPYHCSYCVHSILREDREFSRLRRRSVDNVLEELEVLRRDHGARHFLFHDEIFIYQKEWIREFAAKFKERFGPRGLTFTGYAHPMTTDEEMLDLLWDAGMRRVGMGIQSGSVRIVRDVFDRPFVPERTIQLTRLLAKYPFETVQFDLLTCNPFETDDDRRETFEFLLQLERPFDIECYDLVLFPTSKLGRQKPPIDKIDMDTETWWTMLYYLTGIPEMDRNVLREIAANETYRKRPRELERLVTAITRLNADRKRLLRDGRAPQKQAPQTAPFAGDWRRRLERLFEKIIP